jgi:chromate reductase
MKKICVVSASVGKNLELAHSIVEKLKQDSNINVHLLDLVKLKLPLYSSEIESTHKPEEVVAPFKELLNVDGFIFLAPEYNGAPPPTFTNFLAWVSRSTKNWREAFNGKTALIGTFSGGGGHHVLMSMRHQLSFIGMNVLGRQILSTFQKATTDESLEASLNEFKNRL